jgi:hypothetical protein
MEATLTQDKNDRLVYRVEAVAEDGGCEVTLFMGPHALERAICFAAGGSYYDNWSDPQGLSGS